MEARRIPGITWAIGDVRSTRKEGVPDAKVPHRRSEPFHETASYFNRTRALFSYTTPSAEVQRHTLISREGLFVIASISFPTSPESSRLSRTHWLRNLRQTPPRPGTVSCHQCSPIASFEPPFTTLSSPPAPPVHLWMANAYPTSTRQCSFHAYMFVVFPHLDVFLLIQLRRALRIAQAISAAAWVIHISTTVTQVVEITPILRQLDGRTGAVDAANHEQQRRAAHRTSSVG